ncbi:MAG TPA: protease HtpX [Steroidobacteraceae bacterium]|nr:protease HtpX [Steroidobacteraceae bacterium]
MKRVLLFLLTNLAILLVLGVVADLTGLDAWLARQGGSLGGLLAFAACFGFGGALLSLAMSKWIARRTLGVRVIEIPSNATEQWLTGAVQTLAMRAGIRTPEVGVFESPQPNAFATGARRDAALVAVSTGLLQSMDRDQLEAVLGHEITHVANGDMVTLTLIQGVVNTFVIFLARLVGNVVDRGGTSRDGAGPGAAYFVTVMVAQAVLGVLASMIVMAFSRRREFRADAGGARLAGRAAMIGALERLQAAHDDPLPSQMAAFGIAGGEGGGLRRLFMSHPPLSERIAALRSASLQGS